MKFTENVYEDILQNMYEGLYLLDRDRTISLEQRRPKNHRLFER